MSAAGSPVFSPVELGRTLLVPDAAESFSPVGGPGVLALDLEACSAEAMRPWLASLLAILPGLPCVTIALGEAPVAPSDRGKRTVRITRIAPVVLVVGLIAVLQQLGVQTTSIIAVLGAASIAIGLALQGALSNVAAGVMILLFRPYRVGDTIETGGRQGVVRVLDLFVTELATFDNVRVIIPNGKVFGDVIVNTSAHATRRVDVIIRVDLKRPIDEVIASMRTALANDKRILESPAPLIEGVNLMEAWAELAVRAWVKSADYGPVRSDLYLAARRAVEASGPDQP